MLSPRGTGTSASRSIEPTEEAHMVDEPRS
jgi:hypothetical protein